MYLKVVVVCTLFVLVSARVPRTTLVQLSETAELKDSALPYPVLTNIGAENGYEALLVPTFSKTELGFSLLSGISHVVSTAIVVIQKLIVVLFEKLPGLLLGSAVVLGVCKFTHICTKLAHVTNVWQLKDELNDLVTPERLARAADFLQEAVVKFSAMQNEL